MYRRTQLIGINWNYSHPDMQKIRIIGFFFENRLHWQFEAENMLQRVVLGYTFIYVQIKH